MPLEIYGNGPQKELLWKIIDERKLLRVSLSGYISNVYTEIEKSAGFIMPSRFEGSPLTLLHALKCGMPLAISDQIADSKDAKGQISGESIFVKNCKSHEFASELAKFMQAVERLSKGDYHTVIADESKGNTAIINNEFGEFANITREEIMGNSMIKFLDLQTRK